MVPKWCPNAYVCSGNGLIPGTQEAWELALWRWSDLKDPKRLLQDSQGCSGNRSSVQFSLVTHHVRLFATPWTAAQQAFLSITISLSFLKLMSIESVMPPNHLILCHPLSSCPQSLLASGPFPVSWLFISGGHSIWASVSSSVFPMNIQGWFPLGLTGLISLLSKRLSRVFSNTTIQKHQFFSAQLSSQSNSHIHTWPQEKP